MREVLADVERWRAAGEQIALATVVSVQGSAPRGTGAALAVSAGGEISGSVSGGCVEPAVIEEGMANFKRYFFIMPILAQFELDAHERVERGESFRAGAGAGSAEQAKGRLDFPRVEVQLRPQLEAGREVQP